MSELDALLLKTKYFLTKQREELFQFHKWVSLTDNQSYAWHYNLGKGYKRLVDNLNEFKENIEELIRLQGETKVNKE
jgi:hypothetical protein